MIITSLEDFLLSIPTAEGTDWKALEPFANSADATIQTLLTGSDLYDYIEALEESATLRKTLRNLIAFQLYRDAIPFVDLIQTNNGFAVVNNSNQLPASKERVERLILWCDKYIDKSTDLLIMQIMDDSAALAEWKKFKKFNNLTNCLFLTGIDFADYAPQAPKGDVRGSRADFLGAKGSLMTFQKNELAKVVSLAYLNELIEQNRNNELTVPNTFIVEICKLILVNMYDKNTDEADKLFNNLAYMFEKELNDYPTYAGSEEYALKISPKYVNKASDPVYFFGM